MKRNWKNSIYVFMLLLLLLVAACRNGDHAGHDTYTCPMHPAVVADKPGSCPICGMELVLKTHPGEDVAISKELAQVTKSPDATVVASIKSIRGEYKQMPVVLNAQGIVTYDTRNLYTIPARIGGRLEKVFLTYPFQRVAKGQKVAEIYSPELITAQRELIFLLQNDPENEMLIESAKDKLRLLGATDGQIKTLIDRKEPQNTFAIYSPAAGYVIAEMQQSPAASTTPSPLAGTREELNNTMGGMSPGSSTSRSPSAPATSAESLIREGVYVTAGQTLFKIVNTSALRVDLNIPSASARRVTKGSDVTLDFGNGNKQHGTVNFVQPFFSEGQEFLTVRVYTTHVDNLHIGHLVSAEIKTDSVEALWVPKDAVLTLGTNEIVFIKNKSVFEPKNVITGVHTDHVIEIKQGLSSSDEIAANAHFLVDSESFIKTKK